MKKAIISSLIISLIPGLCAAEHPRVAQLIAEKQQKMKKLEDCKGTTKALKIAGISTLGLTAVGVAGNIAEAVVLSNAKDDVKKAKSELKKQEERQEELQSQKEEQEAKAAEAEAKAKYGSKCINLTKDGQTASFVDSVCRITSSTELKIKENAQSEISKIVGGVCENVRETSTSNTFDAKCDGMSVRVQFGGTSITQSEQNKLDAKKNLIKECNSNWSGKYNEAEDVCIIDKTKEEPVVANNILSTVQGYVNGASCTATTSYSNNTYETECSGMRVRVIFKEIKTADKSACESFGGRQPSGQLCQIQFDKPLVVMDNETVMNAVVKSVEQYIKEKKDQNVQCFAGNKVNDYKESGKTSFTVGCGDNTNMDILVTFRGVKCPDDKKWDSAQMECAKQEVKQEKKAEKPEQQVKPNNEFEKVGLPTKDLSAIRRLIGTYDSSVNTSECKIGNYTEYTLQQDTVICGNTEFVFRKLNRDDRLSESDLKEYFCEKFSGSGYDSNCPPYTKAAEQCMKYVLNDSGKCEKKEDKDFEAKESNPEQKPQVKEEDIRIEQQVVKSAALEAAAQALKFKYNHEYTCDKINNNTVICKNTETNNVVNVIFAKIVPDEEPSASEISAKPAENGVSSGGENKMDSENKTSTLVVNERVFQPNMRFYANKEVEKHTSSNFNCEENPYDAKAECTTDTGKKYMVNFKNFVSNDTVKEKFIHEDDYPADAWKKVSDYINANNAPYTGCQLQEGENSIKCDDFFEFKFRNIKWSIEAEVHGSSVSTWAEAEQQIRDEYQDFVTDSGFHCNKPAIKSKTVICFADNQGYRITYKFKFDYDVPTK